ncbi:CHAT domain-containing protein [Streptomyces sp. NPDC004134]|uniref:CHAT domain-containing tetratricopeptide repeat protein n=1 Tax=Streptomyces sp. NPDC004134 TaxID=3364691 RepID=UPI00367946D4
MRDELAAVDARVRRVEAGRDLAPAVEAAAAREAAALRAVIGSGEGDDRCLVALGWLHWYRFLAYRSDGADGGGGAAGDAELEAAVGLFVPCFLVDRDGIPEELKPAVAAAAVPHVARMYEAAEADAGPRPAVATAALLRRITDALSPAAGAQWQPVRAQLLSDLAAVHQLVFERTGNTADLTAAVDTARQALADTPENGPDRAMCLSNLGTGLRRRFAHTGDHGDLDAAVSCLRQAVDGLPEDHQDHAGALSNLGNALHTRFQHTGALADLETALRLQIRAVELLPAGHPARSATLSCLGTVHQTRYVRTGDEADLTAAVGALRRAVDALPPGHPQRAGMLSNLASALHDRFVRSGAAADLDAAVDTARQAVTATPAGHGDRATYLSNLGTVLRARAEHTGEQRDLDAAVERTREAVDALTAGDPDRARCLFNLGNVLQDRYERSRTGGEGGDGEGDAPDGGPAGTGAAADLADAVAARRAAATAAEAAPALRIRAARAGAVLLARTDAAAAADLAETAVRLLPRVPSRRLERADQQYALGTFAGLAAEAAALALAAGGSAGDRAARALRLLETGRGVLLSQALDSRSDLTDLTARHPRLAARFTALRRELDRPAGPGGEGGDRHRTAAEFEALLAEIRALPGLASFALPPPLAELLGEAAEGPVVVFNVCRYRSDALLLTTDVVTPLELPGLTVRALLERQDVFATALARPAGAAAQRTVSAVLEWLWDTAAGPVLEALGHGTARTDGGNGPGPGVSSPWPRVWWAPGGLLGRLPLHAAGHHGDESGDPGRRTVLDRVVSSYTPTVRALRHARERTRRDGPASGGTGAPLVVAMPTTPGLPGGGRLHAVPAETAVLLRHWPDAVLLTEPDRDGADTAGTPRPYGTHPAGAANGPRTAATAGGDRPVPAAAPPTKAAVLAALPHHRIVHFACHAETDPGDPSRSRLLLHDADTDPLTVASLSPVDLERAELAYLSACRTAGTSGIKLFDESIHLASAFQLGGFPRVIATLWEINDSAAARIAEAFYTHLHADDGRPDPARAAYALHTAVHRERTRRPHAPLLWSAHLHTGA